MKSEPYGPAGAGASMSMTHRASMERILSIENAMDVTTVRYKGLHIWPFVRLQLWERLLHPNKYAPPGTIGLAHMARALSKSFFKPGFYLPYIEHSRRHRDNLARLAQYGGVDVLFFSRPEDHTERIGRRYYNPHLDSLVELVKTRYTYLKLEFSAEETGQTTPRVEHTHFFDSIDYLRCDAQRSIIAAFHDNNEQLRLENGRELAGLLAGTRFDLALTEEYMMLEAERILHYARYFSELLTVLAPKVVFLTHYHYDIAMALVLACKSVGVASVNVQRDHQGRHHAMYSHWHQLPEAGYGLLPDYFWCWGKASAEYLVEGASEPRRFHRPLIGGNRWLARWIERDAGRPPVSAAVRDYLRELASESHVVLVTLPAGRAEVPAMVVEAIRESPPAWRWLIRLHPGQAHQATDLETSLRALHLDRVDVVRPTRYPLYALLGRCHRHVTMHSTVAFEALRFGVSTVVIDAAGWEQFVDYLQRGLFTRAKTAGDLLAALSAPPPNLVETAPYIVTDRMYAVDALAEVMSRAKPAAEPAAGEAEERLLMGDG